MIGVTGFEPAASCSQSRRATNCATPRYQLWNCAEFCFGRPACGAQNCRSFPLAILTAAPKTARFLVRRTRSRFLPKSCGYQLRYTPISTMKLCGILLWSPWLLIDHVFSSQINIISHSPPFVKRLMQNKSSPQKTGTRKEVFMIWR